MTITECIQQRRSVRRFTDEIPSVALIRELLSLATLAPTGSNIQPWVFIIVNNGSTLHMIKTVSPGISGNPPYIIAFCSDKKRAYERGGILGRDEMSVIDVSLAAENFMLASVDHGLGTCAIKSFDASLVSNILSLPPHIHPELLIIAGYPEKDSVSPKRIPLEEIIHFNAWEGEK